MKRKERKLKFPYLHRYTSTLSVSIVAVISVLLTLFSGSLILNHSPPEPEQSQTVPLSSNSTPAALLFVPNEGQTRPEVQFQARGPKGNLFFTPQAVILSLPLDRSGPDEMTAAAVRLRFEGANPQPKLVGQAQQPGQVNYFRGNDPAAWQTNLPTYAGVSYQQLYDGIDLHYDGVAGTLKGTYAVAPGTDPGQIRWRYRGIEATSVNEAGDLVLTLPAAVEGPGRSGAEETGSQSSIVEQAPLAWQMIDGERRPVSVGYDIGTDGSIGFDVGLYNDAYPLVIDPEFVYSTYLGGDDFDEVQSAAVDNNGNVYLTGETNSTDFPTTPGVFTTTLAGLSDVFVTKLTSNGTLAYSTYLGGTNLDTGYGIVVDDAGNAYVTGDTGNPVAGEAERFPTTPGAFSTTYGGGIATFVTKLNPTGSDLIYSTLFGGTGNGGGLDIAIDDAGNAYVIGITKGGLPTKNPAQATEGGGIQDAYVAKFNQDGSDLVYATYLGGDGTEVFGLDSPAGIDVDGIGAAYVTGQIESSADFPTTPGAFDTTLNGTGSSPEDAFVTKLSPDGSSFIYSTYLGGDEGFSSEHSYDILVNAQGQAYVVGTTAAEDFPTQNPLQGSNGGKTDIFISRFNATGSDLLYSTYFGGSSTEAGKRIALDDDQNIYVTGEAGSDFPLKRPVQEEFGGGLDDAFVAKLNPGGNQLIYSTWLGGEDNDEGQGIAALGSGDDAVVYVAGQAGAEFPTINALQSTYGDDTDAFVTKLKVVPLWEIYLPFILK